MRVFLARKQMFLSKNTVHNYMNRVLGLHCICRRKRPASPKGHAHKIFSNLVNQNFTVSQVNRVWCTDFTYIFLANGAVRYNCTIIDLFSNMYELLENCRKVQFYSPAVSYIASR